MQILTRRFCLYFRFTTNNYKVPYNINQQQHATYIKKVKRSQQTLIDNQKLNLVPRRKRRIYDRPKIDYNIQGYGAWRIFEEQQLIFKHTENAMQVFHILIQPKWLVHAFGKGAIPVSNPRSSSYEYCFQDNRFNSYLLYEYRNTTNFKPNKQGYDYENQSHLHPRARISKRMSPEQFWNSEQKHPFRINYTIYAQKFKFGKWLLSQIQNSKNQKSYDEYIDEKYGKSFTFNIKQDIDRFQSLKPIVMNVNPSSFNLPIQNLKKIEKKQSIQQDATKANDGKQKSDKIQKKKAKKQKKEKQTNKQKSQGEAKKDQIIVEEQKSFHLAKTLQERYRVSPKLTDSNNNKKQANKEAKAAKN